MHPEIPRLRKDIDRLGKIVNLQISNNIDITLIEEMSGMEFEQIIGAGFEKLGFRVESTPKTGDYGSDLIVISQSESRISVQCKRFKTKVNLKAVQEVVASLPYYQCDYGIVITNSAFLNSARKLADNNEIELWDKDCLINFLSGDITFSEISKL